MTYKEKYYEIINTGLKEKPENVYTEKHHIIPRSVCILLDKSQENLIYLTAKNHFLAHYYIWKWFKDELHEKKWARSMCYALYRMKRQLMKSNDIERLSDLYEEVRREFSKVQSEEMKGEKNGMYGKHHNENTKQKMRENHYDCRGKKNPFYGKKHTEETRNKILQTRIKFPVVQYTKDMVFVAEFESTREAERRTGVDHKRIIKCCKGKKHYKTAGGFVWKYKN